MVLFFIIAILVDWIYASAYQNSANNFSLTTNLLLLRPVILTGFYAVFLVFAKGFIFEKTSNVLVSAVFLALGLLLGFFITFPREEYLISLRGTIYDTLLLISSSPLNLTFHTTALFAAVGAIRLLPVDKKDNVFFRRFKRKTRR